MSKKTIIALAGSALVIALIIVIWVVMKPKPAVTLKYGYLPIASDASFFVAVERGYFNDQSLRVEPVKFETSNQALEALVAGRIDAVAPVALEAALSLEANTPGQFQIVEMTAATSQTRVHRIIVKSDSPIKTLADLKGKKIGTFPGSQMVVFLKLILGRFFDADKDLEITQLAPPLQPQALETGQVDALFCLEPTCTQIEAKGMGRAIAVNPLYEYIQQPFPTAVGLVSSRLAQERPDALPKIAAALRSSHEFIKAHPDEASTAVPKYAPIQADLAPKIAVYDYWDVGVIDRDAVQRLADFYAEKGVLTKRISTSNLYATSAK